MELTGCPECGQVAEVELRQDVPAGSEDVALVKLRCVQRHWFLMPAGRLVAPDGRTAPVHRLA